MPYGARPGESKRMKLRGSGATAAIGRATDAASRYADAPYGWVTRIGIVAATSARHNRLRHVGATTINARICSGIRIDWQFQLMRATDQYPKTEKQYPRHVSNSNLSHRAPIVCTAVRAAAAC
jgi:hypothetical protein